MRTGGTPAERLGIAEAVLHHAEAAGATEAEVLVMAEDAALTRFANSEIHQNVSEANVRVNLRFVRGTRVGVATTGRTDPDALLRLAGDGGARSPTWSRRRPTGRACRSPGRSGTSTVRSPTARPPRAPSCAPRACGP